jgi:hypothetical protein
VDSVRVSEDTDRPQDAGRKHARTRPRPAAARGLLERWHEALRVELDAVIVELAGRPAPVGLMDTVIDPVIERPSLARRRELVDLGAKVAAALGAGVDPLPPPGPAGASPRRSRRRPDFG